MTVTLRSRLAIMSGAGLVAACVVAGAAYSGLRRVEQDITAMSVASAAVRLHMDGDQMHDAIRSDVMDARQASSTDEQKAATAEMLDHQGIQFTP